MYDHSFVIFVFVFIFLSCDQVDILCIHRCATEIFSPSQLSHLPFIYVTCIYCKKVPKIVKIITITKPSALGMSDPLMDQFNMGRRVDWEVRVDWGAQLTVVFGFLGTPCLMKIWYMLLASLGWEGDENRRRNIKGGRWNLQIGRYPMDTPITLAIQLCYT